MNAQPTTPIPTGRSSVADNAPAGLSVAASQVSHRYGQTQALQEVSFELGAGRIHGLLGRNGAGKTTLLSLIGSMLRPTSGEITVGGRRPFEDEEVMQQICLVRESGDVVTDEKVSVTLDAHEALRSGFDRARAEAILAEFAVPTKRRPGALSRGQQSAIGIAIGLASRAPLTIFDEAQLGLDAPSRQRFYDLLLEDFAESGRTIILSTHLISEVEHLLDTVTILDRGSVLLSGEADDLRGHGLSIIGPDQAVSAATRGLTVVGDRSLGPTRQVTVFDPQIERLVPDFEAAGLTVAAVPLQDLFIHLTGQHPTQEQVS
ncbi:MAG: ABC transporter ATP-binding protein [Actinomycetia bacterium]|nr:ABC transporter ATP-binding protein [Actinomycetes bacterium]